MSDDLTARFEQLTGALGARGVIASVAEGSGASVYLSDSPLQRLLRDVEVLRGHVIFDWDRTTELAGKLSLGGEPGPTDMG